MNKLRVNELSGDGASFTSPNATSLGTFQDGETQDVSPLTCSPPEDQSIWQLFKLFTILNATYDAGQNVSVNCDVLTPLIYFNDTEVNITSGLNSGNPETTLQVSSIGINNDTEVNCISGDCATITSDWTGGS
jgi:hypothetical protein